MRIVRWTVILVCGLGWLVLAAGILAPLTGMAVAAMEQDKISTATVAVPSYGVLLLRSLVLSSTATLGALFMGLLPAAVLGSSSRRIWPIVLGFILAPLLIPPQVYAYAWGLALAPAGWFGKWLFADGSPMWVGGALRSGVISAGWLWPVVAMIVAAGWRSTGQSVYSLALLDTTPTRAFAKAVVPSLRPYLIAAGCLVFAITLLEYAIPHLTLSRVYATELMVLVDIRAPTGQVMQMAAQVIAVVLILITLAFWNVRNIKNWQPFNPDETMEFRQPQRPGTLSIGWIPWAATIIICLITVGVPLVLMATSIRAPSAWAESFILFSRQWLISLGVSLTVALLSVILAISTVALWQVSDRKWLRSIPQLGTWAAFFTAIMPPAALGIGFVTIYNRPDIVGYLYQHTPWVWILSLTARYGAVAILITWLAIGRRGILTAEQARSDGANDIEVLSYVMLPLIWPSLLAAGLIILVLAMFEVIITQLTGPIVFPSLAMTLLGHMHYGRDDVVIITSLAVVAAGIAVSQICGFLLVRMRK